MATKARRRIEAGALTVRGVSRTRLRQFKAACVRLGYTQTEVVESLIEVFVKNPDRFRVQRRERYRRKGSAAWAWMTATGNEESRRGSG